MAGAFYCSSTVFLDPYISVFLTTITKKDKKETKFVWYKGKSTKLEIRRLELKLKSATN